MLRNMLCASPPSSLITRPTVSYLLLPTTMIYLVMSSLNSGALKLIQTSVNAELQKFSSFTLKRPSCYWSFRFLDVFWLLPNLLAEPFWSSHERKSQQIHCITVNCILFLFVPILAIYLGFKSYMRRQCCNSPEFIM